MKKDALDFRNFKKVDEDSQQATLKHPQGHTIKINKNKLGPELKKQLAALPLHKAEGGAATAQNQKPNLREQLKKKVKYMADGGAPEDAPTMDTPANAAAPATVININPSPQLPRMQVPAEWASAEGNPAAATQPLGGPIPAPAPAPQAPAPAPAPAPAAQAPAPAQPSAADAFAQAQGQAIGAEQKAINSSTALGAQGAYGEAAATAAQGQQQAQALDADRQRQQHIGALAQKNLADVMQESQAALADYQNQKINPNHFQESMDTGKRVRTSIGLVLGNIGAAMGGGGVNPVLDYLNKQTDRDIQAQTAEMGKKLNMVSAYQQKFGNVKDATDMATAVQKLLLADDISKAAAQQAGPHAKANAQMLVSKLQGDAQAKLYELSNRRAQLDYMNSVNRQAQTEGPDKAFFDRQQMLNLTGQADLAKDERGRYIPGVGTAQRGVTDKEREEERHSQNLEKAFNEYEGLLKSAGTTGNWTTANKAAGSAARAKIQLELGQLAELGRYTPEEAKQYGNRIPDINSTHFTDADKNLMGQLKQENYDKWDSLRQNLGLPGLYTQYQGHTYRRGPSGEAILVK